METGSVNTHYNGSAKQQIIPVITGDVVQGKGSIMYDKIDNKVKYSDGLKWNTLVSSDSTITKNNKIQQFGTNLLQVFTISRNDVLYVEVSVIALSSNGHVEILKVRGGFKNNAGIISAVTGTKVQRISDVNNLEVNAVVSDNVLQMMLKNNGAEMYTFSLEISAKFLL
ncbi:MAG TPA: hypothetical protein VLE02_01590 [Nitrosarchaeum sp.]|nr:hypothetical protein [Nitrosarchaeum sp.]